jgi:sarcosine oxidase
MKGSTGSSGTLSVVPRIVIGSPRVGGFSVLNFGAVVVGIDWVPVVPCEMTNESAAAGDPRQRRMPYDAAVVGLGAMGSAALWQLARRGVRVVGLDRYEPPHAHGSTHGRTRIIREAYFEHPLYVPLVQRAYAMWDALERASGVELFRATGGLMLGPEQGTLVRGALASARTHRLSHELVDAREVRRRFPALTPPAGDVGVVEPRAGVLFPERGVQAMLDAARAAGAEVRTGTTVTGWRADADGVTVATAGGDVRAARVILAAGAWMPRLVPELAHALSPMRQLGHWFLPAAHPELFRADRLPVMLWEHAPERFFYSLPDVGDGLKASIHHEGRLVDPDDARDPVSPAETEEVRALIRRLMPDGAGTVRETSTCLYTNTPDGHFAIGAHPVHSNVIIASPCSGHGFKFAPAIGEILADLALAGGAAFDLTPFALPRLWRRLAPHTTPHATA